MTQVSRILKGGLTGLALAGLMGVAAVWLTPTPVSAVPIVTGCQDTVLPLPGNPNKVTLCHFTGSDSNPFVINEVSQTAAESHFDHHGDCVMYSDGHEVCF
jgi:hypothetical protein